MRKCESCGKVYQETKDVFCPHCGAVAQKQCTHGSSFDTDRYDRGEIYQKGKIIEQKPSYNPGAEPHAQREATPYNGFGNNSENNNTYSDKHSKTTVIPNFSKMKKTPKNQKSSSKIGAIIFIIIISVNVLAGVFGFDETDDAYDYEDASVFYNEEYSDWEYYASVGSASVRFLDEETEYKSFELSINDLYFAEDSTSVTDSVWEGYLVFDFPVEMGVCRFNEKTVSEDVYIDELSKEQYISAQTLDDPLNCVFVYEFDYDEIVHICTGVSICLENGDYVYAQLPFDAFSISEDGEVTYYTSYSGDDTEWNTVFEECSNETKIDNYGAYIEF
ncbi:MAG: hypothetical protein ACI4VW_03685 [Acutalibacteraceae bacterium]